MPALDELETPAILVDIDVVEGNVARMAEACRRDGVRLRPHAKTHKSLAIGRLQMAAGAAGLTVAKVGEAEVFAAGGVEDLFVAYPVVGADKGRRLLALAEGIRLAVGADSVEGAATLAGVFRAAGRTLDVLLEIDVGLGRTGVAPAQALDAARAIGSLPGLRLRGIFTHAGHVYVTADGGARTAIGRSEGEVMAAVAEGLRAGGVEVEEVSVGSTPTVPRSRAVAGITEVRPGCYVFHDATQVNLGSCTLDECALTVLATVVSVPARGRAVIDAGSKTLSKDPLAPAGGGFGRIVGRASRLETLTEEHGVIRVAEGEAFRVGERVRVLPNHCCAVVNLHDELVGVRAGRVEERLRVDARGRVQ
jgi:D-serine deaminase-like pyridoxal phosphate-dependent protein